ncbi:hypothetical protein CEXT_459191 [Caerostris extrusa]|uniref:Uncharacterized protein n=1 Tax=Caerostris extrusa TaxID=172846 RepID=A0AAV4Q8I4_CAEEX|nr:hypothetical protein CEXT_459191 [Caerostris extrusa]
MRKAKDGGGEGIVDRRKCKKKKKRSKGKLWRSNPTGSQKPVSPPVVCPSYLLNVSKKCVVIRFLDFLNTEAPDFHFTYE